MNYFVLMMLMGVKSDDMKLMGVTYDDTICDLWLGIISKGGCSQIKDQGSHHVRESIKKNIVPPKLRNHALKSMCRNKGAVTKTLCHIKLELGCANMS